MLKEGLQDVRFTCSLTGLENREVKIFAIKYYVVFLHEQIKFRYEEIGFIMKYDIFISYARKDFEEVNRLVGMHPAESGFSESDKEK